MYQQGPIDRLIVDIEFGGSWGVDHDSILYGVKTFLFHPRN